MEKHSTTAPKMCWYLILDWVCVDLLELWKCNEQFSFALKKNLRALVRSFCRQWARVIY